MAKNSLYGTHKAIVIRGAEDTPEDIVKIRQTKNLVQVVVIGHHNDAVKMIFNDLKDPHDIDTEFLKKLSPNNEAAFPYAQISATYFRGENNTLDSAFSSLFKKGDDVLPVIFPKVGDTVWVTFEKGDISRPIYVGTLANDVNGKVSISEGTASDYTEGSTDENTYEGEASIMAYWETGYRTGENACGCITKDPNDKAGGPSYGMQQLSLYQGSLRNFINWLKSKHTDFYKKYFAGLELASGAFDSAWKKAAKDDTDEFIRLQLTYARKDFLNPWLKMAKSKTGIDFSRSMALNELAWARSAQNGVGGTYVVTEPGITSNMNDKEIITRIYDTLLANVETHWPSCPGCWEGVRRRLRDEKKELLALVGKEYPKTVSSDKFGKYAWPVPGATFITSWYGDTNNRARPHEGIDIGDGGIYGKKIIAVTAGTVVNDSNTNPDGYGWHVIIKNSKDGLYTLYGHMQAGSIVVKNGQKVAEGTVLGLVGSTGNSSGPHLHFTVNKDGPYSGDVNPCPYLGIKNVYGTRQKV